MAKKLKVEPTSDALYDFSEIALTIVPRETLKVLGVLCFYLLSQYFRFVKRPIDFKYAIFFSLFPI